MPRTVGDLQRESKTPAQVGREFFVGGVCEAIRQSARIEYSDQRGNHNCCPFAIAIEIRARGVGLTGEATGRLEQLEGAHKGRPYDGERGGDGVPKARPHNGSGRWLGFSGQLARRGSMRAR